MSHVVVEISAVDFETVQAQLADRSDELDPIVRVLRRSAAAVDAEVEADNDRNFVSARVNRSGQRAVPAARLRLPLARTS